MGFAVRRPVIARGNRQRRSAFHDGERILIGVAVRDAAVRAALKDHAGIVPGIGDVTVEAGPSDALEDP